MSSNSSSDGEREIEFLPSKEQKGVARKSTAAPAVVPAVTSVSYTTRRQVALANNKLRPPPPPPVTMTKTLRSASDRFLENFNPDHSLRERKKLQRKINPPSGVRKPPGALYDENGVNIATGIDLCDCLNEECVGCFFECEKCSSHKCGLDCRIHRKFMYDQIEYHGYDIFIKNPLMKH